MKLIAEQTPYANPSIKKGVWAPCLTPFQENYSVDQLRLYKHIRWLIRNGCHGVVLFGTTGEFASVPANERMRTLDYLLDAGISPSKIMVGNGFTALHDTIAATEHALELGCNSFLMMPPFYFKEPSVEGVALSYKHVFERINNTNLRIYLYHFPKMSGIPISFELIDTLLESYAEIIAGLKDSTGDWLSVKSYIEKYPQLSIFAGTDALLLDSILIGGAGTITATADINPGGIRKVYDAFCRGNNVVATNLQKQATAVRNVVSKYPLAAALKSVQSAFTNDPQWGRVCPPLMALAENDRNQLLSSLRSVNFEFD